MVLRRRKTIAIKILIVDDEEMILDLMAEALTDEGYECFVASNVEAAVKVVKSTPGIELIITDLKMPGKTGADLIKTVQAQCEQKVKFIVMSGHASPNVKGNDIDIGAYPFLTKPLGIENLIEKVRSVLEEKG